MILILPIILFFDRAKYSLSMINIDGTDPDDMDKILSYSINTPIFLIAVIIFFIFFILQIIIAVYLISKGTTKFEKRFGKLTFIFGGLGITSIYALIHKLRKTESKPVVVKSSNKTLKIGVMIATPLLLAGAIVPFAMYKGYDKATHMKNVEYSTVTSKQNLIEVFTDGFDPEQMLSYLTTGEESKFLEDFNVFSKYVAPGGETGYSIPSILDGMKSNTFDTKIKNKNATIATLTGGLTDHFLNHMNVIEKTVDQSKAKKLTGDNRYLLNMDGLADGSTYMKSHSGDASFIHGRDMISHSKNQLNLLNWAQAKEDTANDFGFTSSAPQSIYYDWAATHSEVATGSNIKPAHLFLREGITHSARVTDSDGTVSFKTGGTASIDAAVAGLKHGINKFLQNLKDLKGSNGISVYNNSMIIFYGDHANHHVPMPHPGNKNEPKKYHSLAMIKYPNTATTKHPSSVVNTHPFYGAYMNEVIAHWYTNKATKMNDIDFINTNDNFKDGREMIGFYGEEAQYMHFDNNELKIDRKKGKNGWLLFDEYKAMDAAARKRTMQPFMWQDVSTLLPGTFWEGDK